MAEAMDIDGNWVYERMLGCGGFGTVQLWKNLQTHQTIAIKKCRWDVAQLTERQMERWKNEVEIMNHLRHPNIIATVPMPREFQENHNFLPVLCMEYCRRGDLRHVLNRKEHCCGIPERDALTIMCHVLLAVEYLHNKNITHRDLKPENIVLQEWQGKIIYKLIDLGYAKEMGEASSCASIVGTLNYLAPEFLWRQKYSSSVDYWSLGILFYEILTGTRPFLSNMNLTKDWVDHVKGKAYEDICAHEVNGKVVYGKDIGDPTDVSECIRNRLIHWFRLVLQWDPKQRGKLLHSEGKKEIVVFKMFREILSRKIVHVFCVPVYRIFTYETTGATSLGDLQTWIERDTDVTVSQQILMNTEQVLSVKEEPIQDPFLTLFKQGSVLIENLPGPNVPPTVLKMLENPKRPLDNETMRRTYSAVIFFMKQEVKLFRSYILALSMKIDLVNTRFATLKQKIENMMLQTGALISEVESCIQLARNGTVINTWEKAIQATGKKIRTLSEAAYRMKTTFESFSKDPEILKSFADADWTEKSKELLDAALDEIPSVTEVERRTKCEYSPVMSRIVFKFLSLRETQIKEQQITMFAEKISQFENDLLKLEEAINSACSLTGIYRQELLNLQQKRQLVTHAEFNLPDGNVEAFNATTSNNTVASALSSFASSNNGSLDSDDSVIYDNLVIRYMTHDLITEMHESYIKIISLDPSLN